MSLNVDGYKDFTILMDYAGKRRNQVVSPRITANEAIKIANYIKENFFRSDDNLRKVMRLIVDKAWQEATESENVPSTKWADQIIDSVLSSNVN